MARILVIDDDELICRLVVRMLTTAGHDVRHASGGASGLSLWHTAPPDLVITDYAMPDMTGFELVSTLRAEGASVPVIAMSGSLAVSDPEVMRHAEQLGVVQLLAKPFSRDQLFAAVAAALAVATR